MEKAGSTKPKSNKSGSAIAKVFERQNFEDKEYNERNNPNYKLPAEVIKKYDDQAFVLAKSKSGEYSDSKSGSESEKQTSTYSKQKSENMMVEERKQVNQDSNSDNDMKVDHPSNLSHSNKAKRVDGSYGSSNGSTKDRDHSHSSSHNSKDDSDSNASKDSSDGRAKEDEKGNYFEDAIENKTYFIKSSGTIVDMSKRKKKSRKIPMSVKKPVSQYVAFIKSPFKQRPPVMFFPYPSYVGEKKDEFDRVFFKKNEDLGPVTLRFKILETTNIYNALVNSCKAGGMFLIGEKEMLKRRKENQGYDSSDSSDDDEEEECSEFDFNVVWSGGIKDDVLSSLRSYQKINHFPNSFNLGRKDAMYRNLLELEEEFPDDYNFTPKTYVFPQDADEFESARNDPNYDPDKELRLWIFKPSASSCGKGIKILTKDSPIPACKKGFVISEYIPNPHLIEGLKYDLRVYVLVTSYDPLIIYMYDDGLARFATEKFSLDEEHFENRFVHLTNYSLNKKNDNYQQNKSKQSSNLRASKWSLQTLQKVFEDHGKDYKSVKEKMRDVIIKTIISAETKIMEGFDETVKHKNTCFELYGFDILIDSNLKPWLIEVNISPSLSSSSPFDKTLKTKLVCDALTIVGIKPTNHSRNAKDDSKTSLKSNDKPKNINSITTDSIDDEDINLLIEFEEQTRRCENFNLIFPLKTNFKKYTKFFGERRYNNYLLWNHLKDPLLDIESMILN